MQSAAHPLRWRLLAELAHGDRRVRELVALGRQILITDPAGNLAELFRSARTPATH